MSTSVLTADDMRRTLSRMAHEIVESNGGIDDLVVVGVLRRGYPIAKRLAFLMTQLEGVTVPCGKIDIQRFRDDKIARVAETDSSEIPFQVNDRTVVLVDEVIYTGRTIRAAIDALLEFGRPNRVELAVLVDRGHRELPIQPDYCGKTVKTEKADHVVVKVQEFDGEDEVILQLASERLGASS